MVKLKNKDIKITGLQRSILPTDGKSVYGRYKKLPTYTNIPF